ncbi:MAG: CHC2 zinc finger domain-containing protein [Eubacteriales bacterium]|nr:CHC2 zinc finger domain-containing protein [Eubacteriales bacterium]
MTVFDLVRDIPLLDVIHAAAKLELQPRGKDLWGLCPLHAEKTASFTVTPEKGRWYCFGCGAGGDAIKFVEFIFSLSALDAAKWITDTFGLTQDEFTAADARARANERSRQRDIERTVATKLNSAHYVSSMLYRNTVRANQALRYCNPLLVMLELQLEDALDRLSNRDPLVKLAALKDVIRWLK